MKLFQLEPRPPVAAPGRPAGRHAARGGDRSSPPMVRSWSGSADRARPASGLGSRSKTVRQPGLPRWAGSLCRRSVSDTSPARRRQATTGRVRVLGADPGGRRRDRP
jgi:hypothetical protein